MFCTKRKIHFISDELYALTNFGTDDLPDPIPFVSALALDLEKLGCDPALTHVVWSLSKDFAANGVRMVSRKRSLKEAYR